MAKNVEHVSHIKSKLKTNGLPQLPSPDKLVDGEIAVNYAEGVETISIRNENSAITTFSSDNYYTEKKLGSGFTNNDATVTEAIDDLEYMVVNKEEAIAAALNDLNSRKLDASAYTPTDLSNYYTKDETSGKTEIANALNNYYTKSETSGASEIANALNNYYTKSETSGKSEIASAFTEIIDAMEENELIISNTLNYFNDKKLDTSAYTPTDLTNYYTKDETSGKTEISNALGTKVNTATFTAHTADTTIHLTSGNVQTQIDNSISGKVNTADVVSAITSGTSASTYPVSTKAVSDLIKNNEEIVSFALNDLDDRKLDASAMTEVESAVSDLESIVGSGYTNTTITEVIENMDTAIAAALTDLDDKIGDIESILATI